MVTPHARILLALLPAALCLACSVDEQLNPAYELDPPSGWSQWGKSAEHVGSAAVSGQHPARAISTIVYDPFVKWERADGYNDLLIHYQTPLIDGGDVFMEAKSGEYHVCPPRLQDGSLPPGPPCGAAAWDQEEWVEKRFTWENGALAEKWSFKSDWVPPPSQYVTGAWEPVFHAALAGRYLVVPGAGGTIFVVARDSGARVARINPFPTIDPNTYVVGPLTVDAGGNVYYNVVTLDPDTPLKKDVMGAWLVKVSPDGTTRKATFASLTKDAPAATATCRGAFKSDDLPWPPSPDAVPPMLACGSQRPGFNTAPAVGPDGTVYTVSTAHFAHRYSYLVAVNPDLSPRWAASLRDRLHDGCGTATLPPNGEPGGCREGAALGVDPATNELPAGSVSDDSTASPVVAPDGSILYGAYTRYNHAGGHLFQFSPLGEYLAAYGFGWDVTPGIYEHDGTYSVVIKDNRYGTGSYCNDDMYCPADPGLYRITQLNSKLVPEWSFVNTNDQSCARAAGGDITCVSDHPDGFEWCINAPAIDMHGVVYANSEDGRLYAIQQGGALSEQLFLGESVGAAYTPLSLDNQGRIYAENLGQLFVLGE